ncbi:MAG TPA: hypothetical protein PLV21_03270 [Cyclobacteriaceae bacterium]|nr:hypothetical protein [Cyclobacteriaceae bacterium]HRJ80878.1 hypothetical protein [Cyclobacteriaceae bacterium]
MAVVIEVGFTPQIFFTIFEKLNLTVTEYPMTIHITPKTKRQDLVNAARKLKQGKKLDAKKFCGTVKWKEDGLAAQKRMRNEWN